MEAQNPRILNLGSDSKDHLSIHHVILKSSEQHPGKFPFSLCLSISPDGASAVDQDRESLAQWLHFVAKNWVFCSSLNLSSPFTYSTGFKHQPSSFSSCSLPRGSHFPPWLHLCQTCVFPKSVLPGPPSQGASILCIWHSDFEMNILKQTHYINPSSKSC